MELWSHQIKFWCSQNIQKSCFTPIHLIPQLYIKSHCLFWSLLHMSVLPIHIYWTQHVCRVLSSVLMIQTSEGLASFFSEHICCLFHGMVEAHFYLVYRSVCVCLLCNLGFYEMSPLCFFLLLIKWAMWDKRHQTILWSIYKNNMCDHSFYSKVHVQIVRS